MLQRSFHDVQFSAQLRSCSQLRLLAGRESTYPENFSTSPPYPQCAETVQSKQCTMIPERKWQVKRTQVRGTERQDRASDTQPAFAKFTGEKQSLPEKPFDNMWASRTKFFPWIRVRSKKGTQVKKEQKCTWHKIP